MTDQGRLCVARAQYRERVLAAAVEACYAKNDGAELSYTIEGYIATAVDAVLALAPCPFCGGLPPGEAAGSGDLCTCEEPK